MSDGMWHKRLGDFEAFDAITLDVVPRFKTSGISGDEWRQHVRVRFFFKGTVVHEAGFNTMKNALLLLGSEFVRAQEPIPTEVIRMEQAGLCDQASCSAPSISRYAIKKEFTKHGDELAAQDPVPCNYRQFCAKHLRRGDSDREDCDDNYEVISGPGPDGSTNLEESPARQMFVAVDSLDEVPEAIERARRETDGDA